MKRIVLAAVLASIVLSVFGCATVMISAPPSSNVKLLGEIEPAPSKVTIKNWYFLFGLVPISNNATSDVIAKYQFKDVRVKTYMGPVDWIISYLTYGIIYTNTVDIEGNTK